MNIKLPTEQVKKALDNAIFLPGDQHYIIIAHLFPAGRNLDRHIVHTRNQQVIFNWTTSPRLHLSTDINLLDSNIYFCEQHIRQFQNGTHVLLKKFDQSRGSIEDFKQSMILQFESKMYGYRTCIINLSFSEN